MNLDAGALPVARLDDVLQQYTAAMRPISGGAEMDQIEEEVARFRQESGPILQERLEKYAADLQGKSWLREYSRQRFLSLRGPLTIIGNFTLELQTPSWMASCSPAQNAAMLAYSVGKLYLELLSGNIPVPGGNSASVLDEQMRAVLGSARIPRPHTDDYVTFPKEQVRNFGLFYRNRYYLVEILDADGRLLDINQIYSGISRIIKAEQPGLSVNFHTAAYGGSETCSNLLERFARDPGNRRNLDAVEKTLFHLAIKDTNREPAERLLFSDTTDLWPYKPWSFTLYADGALTVNNEHTAADGVTNGHLYQYVLDFMSDIRQELTEGPGGRCEELTFTFSQTDEEELNEIRRKYMDDVSVYQVCEWERGDIDWRQWKALGVGRDALIQLSFLVSSRSVYDCPRCIHESVSTAQYNQGRTSCLRPVTGEMCDAADGFARDMPAAELLTLLQKASKAHSDGIRRAKNNICFVRHGAGMQQMVRLFGEEIGVQEIPAIFKSKGYTRFCTQEISTSTIGGHVIKNFAFSPQVPDGIGIGYLAGEEDLRLSASWNREVLRSGEKFIGALDLFFDRLAALQAELSGT